MRKYIVRRIILFIPILLGVSLAAIIFTVGSGEATSYTEEDVQRVREELGLDRPIPIQYVAWTWDLVRGDLGKSFITNRPIFDDIKRQFAVSLQLSLLSFAATLIFSIPMGILAAVKQDGWLDYVMRGMSVMFLAMPTFFVGLLIAIIFNLLENTGTSFQQLILPAVALGASSSGLLMRLTRTQLLEVLREDCARTPRAKGLAEKAVIIKHSARNALLPVVACAGFQFVILFSGTVVIEVIFGIPGIGRGLVDLVLWGDLPTFQSYVMYLAFLALAINLVVDLIHAWLDPRIRYEREEGLLVKSNTELASTLEPVAPGAPAQWRGSPMRLVRNKPLGAISLLLLLLTLVVAIGANVLAPHDPFEVRVQSILLPPSSEFWFGTDRLGWDILSRTMFGARASILVGLSTMLLAASMGSIVGVSSAYFGGRYDFIVQRVIDVLTALPSLFLALALMAAFGPSFNNVILALAIVFTPRVARVIRSASLSIKETPCVESARSMGASNMRIMLRHMLPNTLPSLIVVAPSLMGSAILIEASLSFLGVGTPAYPIISWGGMLSSWYRDFEAPWSVIFPGFALTLVVFAVNVFGDALRDVLYPKLRGRQPPRQSTTKCKAIRKYIVRRIILFITTLLGVSLAIFILLRVLPGDDLVRRIFLGPA